jgi:hypothetical protein
VHSGHLENHVVHEDRAGGEPGPWALVFEELGGLADDSGRPCHRLGDGAGNPDAGADHDTREAT